MRVWFAVALVLVLVPGTAAAKPAHAVIGSKQRVRLGLTIYSDFGVVQDVRAATLPQGKVDVDFGNVAATIEPDSVRIRSADQAGSFVVLQQTYRYDLVNRQSLLQRYIGKQVEYRTGGGQVREGTLLAINPEIVRFGDRVEIAPKGVISLPAVPDALHAEPTLLWQADNRTAGRRSIETSYLADAISWTADYRLDLNRDENAGALSAWASVRNESGMNYRDAHVSLVAGDVRREEATRPMQPRYAMALAKAEMTDQKSGTVTARPFTDYYRYDLPGTVDLANDETRQFRLMFAPRVTVKKSYELTTQLPGSRMLQGPRKDWFDVRFTFEDRAHDGLGVPLPEGKFRIFSDGAGGAPQLLGEDRLSHTSRGESATVTIGKAFDITARHTQTTFRRLAGESFEMAYRIDLDNRRDNAVSVILDEKFPGDWTLTAQSEPGKRIDSATERYVVKLPAHGKRSLTYTVQIGY